MTQVNDMQDSSGRVVASLSEFSELLLPNTTTPSLIHSTTIDRLPRLDSNQDKESQNLLCYRYTTG